MEEQAKQFKPDPAKANVYVFRDQRLGGRLALDVSVDGHRVGTTILQTFIMTEVEAGRHVVTARRGEDVSEVEFTAEAGRNVFVWLEIEEGWKAGSHVQLVGEARGKSGVEQCRMIWPFR